MIVLSITLAHASASAQAEGGDTAAQGESSGGSTDAEARRAYDLGRAAFAANDFDTAVVHFRRAYLLSARAGLLYNIGQAELRGGHDARALEAFEAYLRQAPLDDVHRGEVEERARMLREMRVDAAAQTPTETADPSVAPVETVPASEPSEVIAPVESTTDDTPREPEIAPWIVLGVGGAVLLGGAISMGVAASEASRVTSPTPGTPWSSLEGVASTADTVWALGLVFLGVGGATATVGLVWGLASGGAEDAQDAQVRLRVGPLGVSLEGEL